ncbi:hypothetical protein AAVH_26581 [Aphelenchoides avenae]|nr:hypothetical protein AAVH_26581 [Aphelenchus avenae]
MSKLFLTVLAFSTVSLAVGHVSLGLDFFVNNPKIKLLSNPAVKDAYPNDDTDYDGLLKALAAFQAPITVEKVKEVLKAHAPKLAKRVQNGEDGFNKVINSVQDPKAKEFLNAEVLKAHAPKLAKRVQNGEDGFNKVINSVQDPKAKEFLNAYLDAIEKYYLQGKETEHLLQLANGLSAEEQKVVAEKLKEAFEAVVKALYDRSL